MLTIWGINLPIFITIFVLFSGIIGLLIYVTYKVKTIKSYSCLPQSDYQTFIPGNTFTVSTGGVSDWTWQYNTTGNYSYNNIPTSATSLFFTDLTQQIRTSASKGFNLTSISFVYNILAENLNSMSATLYLNNYANTTINPLLNVNLPVNETNNISVQTFNIPSSQYNNSVNSNYALEMSVNTGNTSLLQFYGIFLNFTWNSC